MIKKIGVSLLIIFGLYPVFTIFTILFLILCISYGKGSIQSCFEHGDFINPDFVPFIIKNYYTLPLCIAMSAIGIILIAIASYRNK